MNSRFLLPLMFMAVVLLGALNGNTARTQAQEETAGGRANIQFPIQALGNCKDETSCRAYCDRPENIEVCLDFAELQGLMSQEELTAARKFVAAGAKGPGGCTSQDSCEAYCNDVSRLDECIAFADSNEMMSPAELDEARKVQAALKSGATLPGGCRNKKECDLYCTDPAHTEECIVFAEAAGFIPPDELADARRALAAIRKGATPPPCRGKAACDVYCAEEGHFEQCISFAEAAGFVSPEEAQMARRTGGKGPGGCKGKEQCDAFCEDEQNFAVCLAFAEEYGFISKEEAAMARKTGGKGPGGCKGKEECDAFCQNPANQETCFNFGLEHGLIPEEDLRRMEEGKRQMMEALAQAPPQVIECLSASLGSELVEKLRAGSAMPRDIGDAMRQCYEQMGPPPGMGPPSQEQPPGMGPPPDAGLPPGGALGAPPEGMPSAGPPQGGPPLVEPPSVGAPDGAPPEGALPPPPPGGSGDQNVIFGPTEGPPQPSQAIPQQTPQSSASPPAQPQAPTAPESVSASQSTPQSTETPSP